MQTITFYSYKGGVGRTLAVANIARYLARLGKIVFIADFDLEAPGLHFKFGIPAEALTRGVVGLLTDFVQRGALPASLETFVVPIELGGSSLAGGRISLLPAGAAPRAEYWNELSDLNLHALFYGTAAPGSSAVASAPGTALFLELKEAIRAGFNPDFLLIDARTGITELGGVATAFLPDAVVCLLANNQESMEGSRAVLRALSKATPVGRQRPAALFPVLCRIPEMDEPTEANLRESLRSYLTEPDVTGDALKFEEVFVFHSEPLLEIRESLAFTSDEQMAGEPALRLRRDYLKLFNKLIPREIVQSQVESLIDGIKSGFFEDPDGAEQEFEALVREYPSPYGLRELLKLYRARQKPMADLVRVAERLFELAGRSEADVVVPLVKVFLSSERPIRRSPPLSFDFLYRLWSESGADDVQLGLLIAREMINADRKRDAVRVLESLMECEIASSEEVTELMRLLRLAGRPAIALDLKEEWKEKISDAGFLAEWARVATVVGREAARSTLEDPLFPVEIVKGASLEAWANLQRVAGIEVVVPPRVERSVERALRGIESGRGLYRVAEVLREAIPVFAAAGRLSELRERAEVLALDNEDRLRLRHLFDSFALVRDT